MLLERASFGRLLFPTSNRKAKFRNAVSAGIELQAPGRPGAADRHLVNVAPL